MRLISHVSLRLSIAITLILSIWAVFFYYTMIDEIYDEMDDSLEDYSEAIIIRALSGERLPSKNSGSNNQYYLTRISKETAQNTPGILYADSMIYIHEKRETEPARILTTIFRNEKNEYFKLVVSTPSIEKADLQNSIFTWMIILYVTLLLIIILLNIFVFYRSMKPLYHLLRWLDQYRIGHKNEELANKSSITEFNKLYDAVMSYARRNEHLFEQQKRFIGNASHELQTPLAICRNRLEMMMEDENITKKQLKELAKTHQTLEHITRLNKSLLLLSKIENDQFADVQDVCVNDIAKRYLEDYEEVYGYRNIHIRLEETGKLIFKMNGMLASALITNFLKNAFVHNHDNGSILIHIAKNKFHIENSGTPEALDKTKIFERFYKGSRQEGSTGLGLSIIDSICKISGLSVDYNFKGGLHCFDVYKKENSASR